MKIHKQSVAIAVVLIGIISVFALSEQQLSEKAKLQMNVIADPPLLLEVEYPDPYIEDDVVGPIYNGIMTSKLLEVKIKNMELSDDYLTNILVRVRHDTVDLDEDVLVDLAGYVEYHDYGADEIWDTGDDVLTIYNIGSNADLASPNGVSKDLALGTDGVPIFREGYCLDAAQTLSAGVNFLIIKIYIRITISVHIDLFNSDWKIRVWAQGQVA